MSAGLLCINRRFPGDFNVIFDSAVAAEVGRSNLTLAIKELQARKLGEQDVEQLWNPFYDMLKLLSELELLLPPSIPQKPNQERDGDVNVLPGRRKIEEILDWCSQGLADCHKVCEIFQQVGGSHTGSCNDLIVWFAKRDRIQQRLKRVAEARESAIASCMLEKALKRGDRIGVSVISVEETDDQSQITDSRASHLDTNTDCRLSGRTLDNKDDEKGSHRTSLSRQIPKMLVSLNGTQINGTQINNDTTDGGELLAYASLFPSTDLEQGLTIILNGKMEISLQQPLSNTEYELLKCSPSYDDLSYSIVPVNRLVKTFQVTSTQPSFEEESWHVVEL